MNLKSLFSSGSTKTPHGMVSSTNKVHLIVHNIMMTYTTNDYEYDDVQFIYGVSFLTGTPIKNTIFFFNKYILREASA